MTLEMKDATNPRERAAAAIKYVEEHALDILSSITMLPTDAETVDGMVRSNHQTFDFFMHLAFQLNLEPPLAEALFEQVRLLTLNSFALGAYERLPDDMKRYFHQQASRNGGRKAGESKRKVAEDKWRRRAREILSVVAEQNRIPSKLQLIEKLKSAWDGAADALPSDDSIERLVDEMISAGKISLGK